MTKEMSTERKIAYQKARNEFFKMARELNASHGVEIVGVFYSDYHKKPLIYPNHVAAIKTFEKFRKLYVQEQPKNMVTQEEITKQLIIKKMEELKKLRKKNRFTELTIKVYEMKKEDFSANMDPKDVNDLLYVVRENLKQMKEILKARADNEGSTLNIS
ncbi:hypothetical protein KY290_032450 [Solanum tuberosum]|uniref:MADS-box domain-containing protein n=1 Tax=Solanum tuberosum TaxID=4113 RepID=A0ABQ7UC70_SOLTU|nr:PREDICTED: uncharacterized protein LOC107061015 [Solanum tuberosum]KAH0654181.1 hypothetical protein KY289_031859 [Solanum tuberosum]KAH0656788.1 hypothetical protein KY285_031670 [Solanum tuberosum]KAH0744457.1 hypothetical protein KY290_032450 [Solanum tuberosum]